MVHLSDALAVRFHEGMSKANTYSHDNPAAATVAVPDRIDIDVGDYFVLRRTHRRLLWRV
jgi:hypothetical protein